MGDSFKDEKGNTSQNKSNILPTYSTSTQTSLPNMPIYPSSVAPQSFYPPMHPQMFYYQPFRPPVGPSYGSMGYNIPVGHGHISQPYYPMYPTPSAAFLQPTAPVPVPVAASLSSTPRPSDVPSKSQNHPKPVLKAQSKPAPAKNPNPAARPQNSLFSSISSYNLDDPEELEKWKAERRKKFPSGKKGAEVAESVQVSNQNGILSDEEGAILEGDKNEHDDEEAKIHASNNAVKKRKRICKYFSRGKCSKADACPFEHDNTKKQRTDPPPPGNTQSTSRRTIFEKLMKIEEKELMIKFYGCIKTIVNNKK